jgi:hypothetical protein
MSFVLKEVDNRKNRKDFLKLPVKTLPRLSQWIRPLDNDIESVFNQKSTSSSGMAKPLDGCFTPVMSLLGGLPHLLTTR